MRARREILAGSLAFGFLPASVTASRGQGQSGRDERVLSALAQGRRGAEEALFLTMALGPSDARSRIESENEAVFGQVRRALQNVPKEQLASYVEPTLADLSAAMTKQGIDFAQLPYVRLYPPDAAPPSAKPNEDVFDVAVDILKDCFGIKDLSVDGLRKLFAEIGMAEIFRQLGRAIRAGNLALAGQAMRAILTSIGTQSKLLAAIETALGQQAMRDILVRVGVRFVPLFGWPLLIASLLVAVWRHRDRLLAALRSIQL